jgi:4-hydroxy 2-oxovalerate aldolase
VELAEEYYQAYQKKYYDDAPTLAVLEKELRGKELLILAPGKSLETQQEAIRRYMAEKQPVVLAVNVAPEGYAADYLFCANEKRFSGIQRTAGCTLIVSSNITQAADALKINYSSYLSENADIADNPTLMVFRLLIALGIPSAAVAGFDGYGAAAQENYFDKSLSMGSSLSLKLKRNGLIKAEVAALQKQLHITFVTPSKYTE